MKNYSMLTDYRLLYLYKQGDRWAFDELLERYRDTVKYHATFFFLPGGDREDLIQEGMIGLFDAVTSYKDDRNATFATFAARCIRSRMIKAVVSGNKEGNIPLNTSISLESEDGEDMLYRRSTEGNDSVHNGGDPEKIVMSKEYMRITIEKIRGSLSELERKVFDLFLEGLNYREIADELDMSPKSVDNALHRIMTKVKNIDIS